MKVTKKFMQSFRVFDKQSNLIKYFLNTSHMRHLFVCLIFTDVKLSGPVTSKFGFLMFVIFDMPVNVYPCQVSRFT